MRRYTNSEESNSQNPGNTQPNSHHSNSKVTISFPPQVTHYDQEDSSNPVQVYLHSHNSKSLKIQLPSKISILEIKKIVEEKIGIKKDQQLLYLNGKNITEYGHIRLQPLSIIHISNIRELCNSNQEIHLKLTIMNFVDQKQTKIHKNFTASPNERISDFLQRLEKEARNLFTFKDQNVQYFLLQSSRLLQRQKTFAEQDVTRQSDVICMLTKHEVKTRFTNDTKQEILHDISELLGFSEETQSKPEPKAQERSVRPRYSRQQPKKQETRRQPEQEYSYSSAQSFNSFAVPNFKKKPSLIYKATSFQETPNNGLIKKIKSSKPKRYLDFLLNSQKKQTFVFESPDAIKEEGRQIQKKQEEPEVKQIPKDLVKPTPQIPKVMPINERRQIRLEIQQLFDFNESSKKAATPQSNQSKEEKKPISPPTEVPKPKQKMRLSMGSRPAFLDQLRNLKEQ